MAPLEVQKCRKKSHWNKSIPQAFLLDVFSHIKLIGNTVWKFSWVFWYLVFRRFLPKNDSNLHIVRKNCFDWPKYIEQVARRRGIERSTLLRTNNKFDLLKCIDWATPGQTIKCKAFTDWAPMLFLTRFFLPSLKLTTSMSSWSESSASSRPWTAALILVWWWWLGFEPSAPPSNPLPRTPPAGREATPLLTTAAVEATLGALTHFDRSYSLSW